MVEAEPTRFFSFWTAKEALLKALGPGMSMPPTSLDIAPGLGGSIRLASAPQGVSARQPRVWPLVAPSGYAAALAWVGAA